jgi:beta-glucosidase
MAPEDDVLRQLSLPEKASLCLGADFWHTAAVERLGIPGVLVSDGPHGLRVQPMEGDHVGLGGSLPATCFPTASSLASTWDVALIEEVGAAIGLEARSQDVAVVLGPGVNIRRSPLCGRNFEYFSEDPYLAGRLGAALVHGIQGQGVGTSVKHFAANNQETDRLRVSADVDERTLREIYLPAFEHIVTTAHPWTVMCAYNRVNGVHASRNRRLLTEVLRDEWGFGGLVVSDWGAVHDRVAAVEAGLDLEMPPNLGVSDAALVAAVERGELDESVLDDSVRRVLQLVDRAAARQPADPDVDAHHALARRAAAAGIVLLKNADAVLPLTGRHVCVVGEFARTPRYQGAGSSQVNPTRVDVPLEELRRALPDREVTFAAGFLLDEAEAHDARSRELADEAVAAAASADVVVAFLGLPPSAESEGFDRTHLDLPAAQTDLLHRLLAGRTPVVVVLANGSTVQVTPWDEQAAAVVECWLGGQAAGGAIADVLTGAVNPSGRLSETVPLRLQDTPSYLNFPGEHGHVRYGEGIFVGYRGYDAVARDVAYPFGHGLSYTSFEYRDLSVRAGGSPDDVAVEVTVRNVGAVAGTEVVQLYVADPVSSVPRPPRELKGFAACVLDPGAETTLSFSLDARDLSYWSTVHGGWVVEGGEFVVEIGASSRDIRLRASVQVDAALPPVPLDGMSTLEEWLADPESGPALLAAVGVDEHGRPRGIVGDDELRSVIGNFPLSTLAAFPGLGITREIVQSLTGPRAT